MLSDKIRLHRCMLAPGRSMPLDAMNDEPWRDPWSSILQSRTTDT